MLNPLRAYVVTKKPKKIGDEWSPDEIFQKITSSKSVDQHTICQLADSLGVKFSVRLPQLKSHKQM